MSHILLYSAITHYTALINTTLHLFLSSNPAQPVLSLNSNPTHSPDSVSTSYTSPPLYCLLPTYTISKCFSYLLLLSPSHFLPYLILQFTHHHPHYPVQTFSSKPHSLHHPIPLSSLSFSITIITSRLSSISTTPLPNNTFIPSLLSSSFLHPRSPNTTTPATLLLASNNSLLTLICTDSSFLHTLCPPEHHISAVCSKPGLPISSHILLVNFHLYIHSGHPCHLSYQFFCLLHTIFSKWTLPHSFLSNHTPKYLIFFLLFRCLLTNFPTRSTFLLPNYHNLALLTVNLHPPPNPICLNHLQHSLQLHLLSLPPSQCHPHI